MTAKTVYQNPWFEVVQDGRWHYIYEPNAQQGAVIIARQEQEFILVRIPRHAQQSLQLEFPRGYGEANETAVQAAVRELCEETGFTVAANTLVALGEVRPNTAILASRLPVFYVDIPPNQAPEQHDEEAVEVVRLTGEQLDQQIAEGVISCGITLAALQLFYVKQRTDFSANG